MTTNLEERARELAQRITDYLSSGGLVNPEMARHDHVRDLLIDCREALAEMPRVQAEARLECAEKLERVAKQYGAGGHTHREKMLNALAAEIRAQAAAPTKEDNP